MESDRIKVSFEEATAPPPDEDRFQRFSLIGWWDQTRIRNAHVLVVGAGALGNEIVKNLSLLGFGNLFVADLDAIENSNLSRSVLYRAKDNGSSKAKTAVRAAKGLFPDMKAMLTPVFHPNIEPAIICIGDHWTASERLCDLVVRIGEMIAYQAHNIKSPLDGEAAMWTDLNQDILPIDSRDLTPPEN